MIMMMYADVSDRSVTLHASDVAGPAMPAGMMGMIDSYSFLLARGLENKQHHAGFSYLK